jgi:polyhydroxyalkanoate synthase
MSRPAWRVARTARRARRPHLGKQLARVAAGRSTARPEKRDRRFADPAWESSWLFGRLLQTYLALGEAIDGAITDAWLDWRHERRPASPPATCSTRSPRPTSR